MAALGTVDTSCDCDGEEEEAAKIPPKRRRGYIPYSTIYESKDEVRKNGYWIPGISVQATIIKVKRDTSLGYHILNPFIYTIELEHGRYKWRVIKRYKDFTYLSTRLMAHRAAEVIKAPVRRARNRIEEVIEGVTDEDEKKGKHKSKSSVESVYELRVLARSPDLDEYNEGCIAENTWDQGVRNMTSDSDNETTLPNFPVVPDSMLSENQMNERARKLEKWLQSVLAIPINREYHETAEFLDVSRFSFINELGGKYKEGNVKKKPGGNKVYIGLKQFCFRWLLPWNKRWLMVKDTYVCYMDPSDEKIHLVLLFDEQFEVNSPELAVNIGPKEFVISNLQHVLMMKSSNEENTQNWVDTIKDILEDSGQIWLNRKRHGSSFPQRLNSYCQWFVDAKDCWEKAASMIEMATCNGSILANNFTKSVRIKEQQIIDKIWKPDTLFFNSKYSYFHLVSFPNFLMRIRPDGHVTYTSRVTLLPDCQMNFCNFPHDTQRCRLLISSIAHPKSMLEYNWDPEQPIVFAKQISLPDLHIQEIGTGPCSIGGKLIPSSCLSLSFVLERASARYIAEKYMPSTLAMIFSWVAPYVPYNYEEVRIITPITVLLTLVQMEKGNQEVITSYLTSLDIWFVVIKAFTVLSLVESLTVMAYIKRGRAVEKQAQRASNEYQKDVLQAEAKRIVRVYHRLDHFSRVCFPVAFLCFLIFYVGFIVQRDEQSCREQLIDLDNLDAII